MLLASQRKHASFPALFMSAPANSTPVVSANGLVVRYGPTTLLAGSTIALHEGEHVGLVGRNGCGKAPCLKSSRVIWNRMRAKSRAAAES